MKKVILLINLSLTMFFASAQDAFQMDLVAYYPFNGNGNDSSGNNNHGLVNTGVTSIADRNGKTNKAYYFNGQSDAHVSVPSSVSTNTSNFENFTISLWFRANGTGNIQRRIINIQDNLRRNYELSFDFTNNKLCYINWDGFSPANIIYSNKVFDIGKWNHVVIRIDSLNTTSLFINGSLDNFSSNTVEKPNNPIISIGQNLTSGWNFQGGIDEVRLYKRYLSNQEINILAKNLEAPKPTVYYSKFYGRLDSLGTWGSNKDGTGVSPNSFDEDSLTLFLVNNTSPKLINSLILKGKKSTIIMGDSQQVVSLEIPKGKSIDCDSIYMKNGFKLSVSGNLNVNKFLAQNSSLVQFVGSSPQIIPKGSYYNLTVDSTYKNIIGDVKVLNNLVLKTDIFCGTSVVTLGLNELQTGRLIRTNGSIVGAFARWFSASASADLAYLFPIGISKSTYRPIIVNVINSPTSGGLVTAKFIEGATNNSGLPIFDDKLELNQILKSGYWKLQNSGGSVSGGIFSVTCVATDFEGVRDYKNLRLLKRQVGGLWSLDPSRTASYGSNKSPELIRTGLTIFEGEYGVASDSSTNPTSMISLNKDAIKFFISPNPFSSSLFVFNQDKNPQSYHIQLFDGRGSLVFENSFEIAREAQFSIEGLNNLQNGIYLAKLSCGNHSEIIKLIKE